MGQSISAARPQKAILVALVLRSASRSSTIEHLDELERLAATAGAECVGRVMQDRPSPDPATWIGKGKAEEIKALAVEREADLVIFDDDLTAAQARNLEKIIEKQVIDRSGLILDIFVRHARSREARTQVELAQLNYMLPRLTRAWTHLERQAGGIGTRGVGETQLEIDRRLIRNRIAKLKLELQHIEKTRVTQRRGRRDASTVALVGYTNAGKSTLFNRLAGGTAYAANQLFATLDAKLQKASFDAPRETVMIDTVGFIRKLPHHLVASFRSTMEEAASADLVLHVIDASHAAFEEQRTIGNEVLGDLGVEPARVIEVYNKSDLPLGVEDGDLPLSAIRVSALTGEGLERLIEAICERQFAGGRLVRLDIPSSEGKLLARLHEVARIHRQTPHDGGVDLIAWIPEEQAHVFKAFEVVEAG
ncbi:MAG: GTPase HflX [Thermoanaerobaculia bacterium]|nr:GTPase HflX [Thermoanaerobaculia bacterium]